MLILSILTILFCAVSSSRAELFEVPPISSIGQALSQTSANDTVLVHPGLYEERLILPTHDFVLMSEFLLSGDSTDLFNTIIDASLFAEEQTACVLYFPQGLSRSTVVAGFTLRGGHGFQNENDIRVGGCIYGEMTNPQIIHNIIEQNDCRGYVAFFLESSTGRVANNIIRDNQAWSGLGRCYYNITYGPPFEFDENEIYGNYVSPDAPDPWLWDPGISFVQSRAHARMNHFHDYEGAQVLGLEYQSSYGEVSDNVFENISTEYFGFLIAASDFHIDIHDNIFRNCVTYDGAAIDLIPYTRPPQPFHIWRNWFENLTNGGGGPSCISSQYPRALIEENVFINCTGATGAIQFASQPPYGCEVELRYNSFFGNRSDWQGQPIAGGAISDDNITGLYANVHQNWFDGNFSFAVFPAHPESGTWNLANNYWGDASGPYHATQNPQGLGDTLGDGVSFTQWLTEPPDTTSSIAPPRALQPNDWKLGSPFPNPFNSNVSFELSSHLPQPFDVQIYNTLGRQVKLLWRGVVPRDGTVRISWNGDDDFGVTAAAGIYYIHAIARGTGGASAKTVKAALLR